MISVPMWLYAMGYRSFAAPRLYTNEFTMNRIRIYLLITLLLLVVLPARAQSVSKPTLQELVNQAAHTALEKFADKKLTQDQLSITLIDLRDPQHPSMASFRGNERVYPASVVKLFYFVAVHRWLEDKKIQETAELKRARARHDRRFIE